MDNETFTFGYIVELDEGMRLLGSFDFHRKLFNPFLELIPVKIKNSIQKQLSKKNILLPFEIKLNTDLFVSFDAIIGETQETSDISEQFIPFKVIIFHKSVAPIETISFIQHSFIMSSENVYFSEKI